MKKILSCENCNLYKNQNPLLDKAQKAEITWIGLSAKKIDSSKIPLSKKTNTGKIIEKINKNLPNLFKSNNSLNKIGK